MVLTLSVLPCRLKVAQFPELIAVAYNFATSFDDPRARSFKLDQLFAPQFGPDLRKNLLDILKGKNISGFDLFSDFDSLGNPMNPSNKEVFDVEKYLKELQFGLDLSPEVKFSSPAFKSSDILESLYPQSLPSVKGLVQFVKNKLIPQLIGQLKGLFDASLDVPTGGLTVNNAAIGGDGLNLGDYSAQSTALFPPTVDFDQVQASCLVVCT